MEKVLDLYEQPSNPKRPLICYDERPCQLISDVVLPLPMKPGSPRRQDSHYKRNGICSILIAFEPLTGKRFIRVCRQRTKKEYSESMKELADVHYREAEKVVLIQDNLNTHTPGSFYENYSAGEAFRLAQRFDMHYTPKRGSWLNMVEIELSILSKQCLDRRIGDIDTLEREVKAWVEERNRQGLTVQWRFTKKNARDRLKRFYPVN
jgi:DDE superfamily endonuclease